ncbi:MAG TPA: DUF6438 domain-containing protein [Adhaeribacter sp.]|nr:DUF6438 domain-containing protein [Adhaeribacter sp.]
MKFISPGALTFCLLFTMLLLGRYGNTSARITEALQPAKTLLIFEKKPCFGFCPVYKAEFLSTGEVKVKYTRPYRPAQTETFRLSKDEVCELWTRGEKLGVFKMKNRYETLITDFQVRELTLFDKGGLPKNIYYTEGASPEFELYLRDLADLVERNLKVSFEPEKEENK